MLVHAPHVAFPVSTHMRKQCVPGTISPSSSPRLGTRLTVGYKYDIPIIRLPLILQARDLETLVSHCAWFLHVLNLAAGGLLTYF